MFSTSLRQRREWKTVPSLLLAYQDARWKEDSLATHDLCLPVVIQSMEQAPSSILLLLLSATDLEPPDSAMERIQRLHLQGGGNHVGIVFLLHEKSDTGNGVVSMVNLQLSLQGGLEIPIIPLYDVPSLADTVLGFHRQLCSARSPTLRPNPRTTLLPFCSNSTPIPEGALNVLDEICSSIPEVARLASSEDGQKLLRDVLPESHVHGGVRTQIAEDIIEFWQEEIIE